MQGLLLISSRSDISSFSRLRGKHIETDACGGYIELRDPPPSAIYRQKGSISRCARVRYTLASSRSRCSLREREGFFRAAFRGQGVPRGISSAKHISRPQDISRAKHNSSVLRSPHWRLRHVIWRLAPTSFDRLRSTSLLRQQHITARSAHH